VCARLMHVSVIVANHSQ